MKNQINKEVNDIILSRMLIVYYEYKKWILVFYRFIRYRGAKRNIEKKRIKEQIKYYENLLAQIKKDYIRPRFVYLFGNKYFR